MPSYEKSVEVAGRGAYLCDSTDVWEGGGDEVDGRHVRERGSVRVQLPAREK